jgi:predicted ATPase
VITSLTIRHFKCFADTELAFRSLTLLTGLNGAGKSTIIQALLLARQAATGGSTATVKLNGPYGLALGEAHELLHPSAERPGFGLGFRDETTTPMAAYSFGIPGERALHLTIDEAPERSPSGLDRPGTGFTYLCAERFGPRDLLPVSAEPPDELGVGVQGEYTAQVLALREMRLTTRSLTVRSALLSPDNPEVPLLRAQTEAWASHIIRPLRIEAQWTAGQGAGTLRFQGTSGDVIRPANTGFGVSYALPIIVAGLMTQPGDILIVENPEAHLHPAGQSRMGHFLARVAGSGVQVIVETHSDHVLNGSRLAVAADDPSLPPSGFVAHYFDHEGITPIGITDRGELSHWPDGFFDQIEDDLGRLARARRRR